MKFLKRIRAWWRGLFRKRRFSMLNATDNSEEWHIHLSPASVFAGLVAFVLLLFILTLSLVAYSPVLEFLPGYRTEADRSRESLLQNIIRLDSMERMMNDMMTYNRNIALIMEGRTPVARTLAASDSSRISKVLVMPSPEDSLLRAQMEGDGEYAIAPRSEGSRRKIREAIELATPVEGIITGRFDIKQGNFGVKIAAAAGDRIAAIDNGTVVQSLWAPEAGYTVVLAADGLEGIEQFRANKPDLVLLDLMLPKIDGFAVCEILRKESRVPIIMLTALDDDDSQMKGFDALADDYITKPFSMPVVMKHIEAVLRRAEQGGAAPNNVIRYKEITVDTDSLTVLVGTESVSLTTREFEILKLLLENQGRVVSRERLLDTVWGYDYVGDEKIINTHIKNIRKKLGVDYIETMRGAGYKIEKED